MDKQEVQDIIDGNAVKIEEAYNTLLDAYQDFYKDLIKAEAVNFACVLLHQRNVVASTEQALLNTCLELVTLAVDAGVLKEKNDDTLN